MTRIGLCTRDSAAHLREQLTRLEAPVLGIVANAIKLGRGRRYGYGYYGGDGYGYGPPQWQAGGHRTGQGAQARVRPVPRSAVEHAQPDDCAPISTKSLPNCLILRAAAAYVVVSVGALVARRQWLIRVGPVEVSAQASELDAETQR